MMRIGLIAGFIVLAVGGAAARDVPQGGVPAIAPMTAYDDFMKLSGDQRRARFGAISAENKAMIMRTHVERWLQSNRGRLTASEVAVFEEMIAFITPDIYRNRPDGTMGKREEALRATMRCRVSPDDVREATNVLRGAGASPTPKPTWSYLSQAKCWIDWFLEGLVDYVPSPRR